MAKNLEQFANQPGRQLRERAEAGFDYSRGGARSPQPQSEFQPAIEPRMTTLDIQPVLDGDGKLANGGRSGSHDVYMLVDIKERGGDTARDYRVIAELQTRCQYREAGTPHEDKTGGKTENKEPEQPPVRDVRYYQVPWDADAVSLRAGKLKDMGFPEMDEKTALGQMKQERQFLDSYARSDATKIAVYDKSGHDALQSAKFGEVIVSERKALEENPSRSRAMLDSYEAQLARVGSDKLYETYLDSIIRFSKGGQTERDHMVADAGAKAEALKSELQAQQQQGKAPQADMRDVQASGGRGTDYGASAIAQATATFNGLQNGLQGRDDPSKPPEFGQ